AQGGFTVGLSGEGGDLVLGVRERDRIRSVGEQEGLATAHYRGVPGGDPAFGAVGQEQGAAAAQYGHHRQGCAVGEADGPRRLQDSVGEYGAFGPDTAQQFTQGVHTLERRRIPIEYGSSAIDRPAISGWNGTDRTAEKSEHPGGFRATHPARGHRDRSHRTGRRRPSPTRFADRPYRPPHRPPAHRRGLPDRPA